MAMIECCVEESRMERSSASSMAGQLPIRQGRPRVYPQAYVDRCGEYVAARRPRGAGSAVGEQSATAGVRRQLGLAVDVELPHQVRAMRLGRALADAEPRGDLRVRQTFG